MHTTSVATVSGQPRRVLLVDALTATICLAIMVYAWIPLSAMAVALAPYLIVCLGLCVCIALRRRFPAPSLVALVVILVVHILAIREITVAAAIAACFGAFTTQVHTHPPWRTGFNTALVVGPVVAVLLVPRMRLSDWKPAGLVLLAIWGVLAIAALMGVLRRSRLSEAQRLLQAVRDQEIARAREARLVELGERAHIAREMHDLIAHSLGVIVAQADGGRYAATARPEAAIEALSTIGELGRTSMTEMRRLIAVLRDESDQREASPAPDLTTLPQLLDDYHDAGLTVHLTESGAPVPVPAATALTAYRVVQESLSNVLRHAGPTAVALELKWEPATLTITVTNPTATAPPAPRTGHGLTGMRERVRLHGGTLQAGPTRQGWRVRALIPFGEEAD